MKTPLFEKIVALLDLESGKRYNVLDIGCGSGDFLSISAVAAIPRFCRNRASTGKNPRPGRTGVPMG
jgi:hypothetical protein